jgi:hypothetical protein
MNPVIAENYIMKIEPFKDRLEGNLFCKYCKLKFFSTNLADYSILIQHMMKKLIEEHEDSLCLHYMSCKDRMDSLK